MNDATLNQKYQAYPEYKDSGVEWVGEIPEHWEMWKLAHAYKEIGSGTTPPSNSEEWFGGDIPWVTTSELRESTIYETKKYISKNTLKHFSALNVYPKRSIAMAMYGATIGRLGIFGENATTNQACCVLTQSDVIFNKYIFYWLWAFRQEIINLSSGGGQPNINQEKVASLKVSAPSVSDQIQIANFLDYETAKIDTLIDKQEQLIKLLKEKRQAVISHAVTKGLNPDAPMKDSGVEWLGEVPVHWIPTPLKHYADVIDCKHITAIFQDTGYPVASISEVKGWNVNLDNSKKTSKFFYDKLIEGNRQPVVGDIIYSRNATVGDAALVKENMPKFAMGQDVCLIRAKKYISPSFLLYALSSEAVKSQLRLAMVGSTFKRINVDNIRNFYLVLPEFSEQVEIVNYLSKTRLQHDIILEQSALKVRLLKERRTALISAAVTGKIDVRLWKKPDD